jgi:hypothetical protein
MAQRGMGIIHLPPPKDLSLAAFARKMGAPLFCVLDRSHFPHAKARDPASDVLFSGVLLFSGAQRL